MAEDKKKEEIAVIDITEEYLKERIYEIRGQRVILDADLSEIYGYTTKAFNQQVKNNIEKFDEDFMFELTDDEVENLRSNFLTANLNSKSRYKSQIYELKKNQIDADSIYGFLGAFNEVYSECTDAEKKQFMQAFIECIDIFPERREDGNWIQNIKFQFPVPIIKEGKEVAQIKGISLDKEKSDEHTVTLEKLSTIETVVLMSRKDK